MIARAPMADIKDLVAAHYGVTLTDLLSERRSGGIVWPRHVAIYLCRRHTLFSLARIGRGFGDRDHSTVRFAIDRVSERIHRDPRAAQEVEALSAEIVTTAYAELAREDADLRAAGQEAARRLLHETIVDIHRRRAERLKAAL